MAREAPSRSCDPFWGPRELRPGSTEARPCPSFLLAEFSSGPASPTVACSDFCSLFWSIFQHLPSPEDVPANAVFPDSIVLEEVTRRGPVHSLLAGPWLAASPAHSVSWTRSLGTDSDGVWPPSACSAR